MYLRCPPSFETGTQFGAGGASGKSAPEMTLSALKAGNVGVLGLFLDAGYVSVSASTIKVACQQNNPQLVELLLKHSTALEGTMLSASSSGNPLLFDMIMQAGGNICEKDAMGNTVLFQRSFNKDIYEYSLRAGVDIEAVNYRGRTALLEAARFCGSYQWAIDKLQFFVDNKAKTEVATPDGVTVWHLLTVPRCYPQAIKILCRSAHTSLTSGKGLDSPLHVFVRRYLALEPAMYAEKRAVLHACYLLLRYGADANETGFDGKTALQLAAVHDNDQGSDKGQSAADKKRTSDCNRNRIRNCQPSGTTDGANESDAEIGQHRRLYRPFKKWLTLLLRREAQMSPEGLFCCAGVRTIRVAVDSRLHSNTPVFAVDGVDGQSTVKQIINRVRHELEIRVDMGLTLQSMKGEDVLEEHLTLAALHLIPEHDRLGGHRESDHDKFGHKDSDTSPAEPALHVIPMMDISPSQFLEFYSAAYGDTF